MTCECQTCLDLGVIDESLGGYSDIHGLVKCPDCADGFSNQILTKPDYWLEQSLPLWQLQDNNEYKTQCESRGHAYSVFREGVAYCSWCGMTLDYEEGLESYE
ncbi:hypothetical protein [Pseudomonas phage vB_PsaM_M1]|nr:hypothetical protein [Pseudomonas phage vB_PsaM_M1]